MVRYITTIWNCFLTAKVTLGMTKVKGSKYAILQKIFSAYLKLGFVALFLSIAWSLYKSENTSSTIENSLKLFLMGFYIPLWIHLQCNFTLIDSILTLVEGLHRKYGQYDCFIACHKASTRLATTLIWVFPILSIFMVIFDCVVMNLVKGQWESTALSPPPFGSATIFMYLFHCGGAFITYITFGTVNATMLIGILHLNATLEYLQLRLHALTPCTSMIQFQNTVEEVVTIHCQLIEFQTLLFNFAYIPTMAFEFLVYMFLLLIWIVVFFIPESISGAIVSFGVVVLYLILCAFNESSGKLFDDLKVTLYNLEWYNMSPAKQKMILMIMMVVDNPKSMRCGPFHKICYEEFKIMLHRTYSYGLCMNKYYS